MIWVVNEEKKYNEDLDTECQNLFQIFQTSPVNLNKRKT